jgi:hypothetical protein
MLKIWHLDDSFRDFEEDEPRRPNNSFYVEERDHRRFEVQYDDDDFHDLKYKSHKSKEAAQSAGLSHKQEGAPAIAFPHEPPKAPKQIPWELKAFPWVSSNNSWMLPDEVSYAAWMPADEPTGTYGENSGSISSLPVAQPSICTAFDGEKAQEDAKERTFIAQGLLKGAKPKYQETLSDDESNAIFEVEESSHLEGSHAEAAETIEKTEKANISDSTSRSAMVHATRCLKTLEAAKEKSSEALQKTVIREKAASEAMAQAPARTFAQSSLRCTRRLHKRPWRTNSAKKRHWKSSN